MSSDWRPMRIKEFGHIITGKTPPTSREDYFGDEIPFLTPTDMNGDKRTVVATRGLTKAGLQSVKSCLIPRGIAVSCIGWQMGKSVLVLEPTVTNQQINTIVVDESRFDLLYVYYLLSSLRKKIFELGATPTRTPIVNKTTFGEISVYVPEIEAQYKIARTLGVLDDRIDLLRETNTTLESIAQTLFKSWFVDFDPVRAKQEGRIPEGMNSKTAELFPSECEESEYGNVPRGWCVQPLDSIAEYLNGLALQKYPPEECNWLPVIKIAQMRKGDTFGADQASGNLKPEYIIQDGDVLFSWSGSLEVAIWCGGSGALNQHIFKVTSKNYPKWFYYLWTKHHLANFQQIAASKATTMGHIQRKHLTEAKVFVPSRELIWAANEYLNPLIERWICNSITAKHLAELRDSLLPRLISGQLRLPDAEALIKEAA